MKVYLGEEGRGGGRGGVEKGGGSGCCNTATYSTGEGGAMMERERGEIIIQIIIQLIMLLKNFFGNYFGNYLHIIK